MSQLPPAPKKTKKTQSQKRENPIPVNATVMTTMSQSAEVPRTQLSTLHQEVGSVPPSSDFNGRISENISTIWQTLDANPYLAFTGKFALRDVSIQPCKITGGADNGLETICKQIVTGETILTREVNIKIHCLDLLRMLYLAEKYNRALMGIEAVTYTAWYNEKKEAYKTKNAGYDHASEGELCQFMLTENNPSFFPPCLGGQFGLFFRKISVSDYVNDCSVEKCVDKNATTQFENPSIITSKPKNASFEHMIEAKIIFFPVGWITAEVSSSEEDLPPTQPLL